MACETNSNSDPCDIQGDCKYDEPVFRCVHVCKPRNVRIFQQPTVCKRIGKMRQRILEDMLVPLCTFHYNRFQRNRTTMTEFQLLNQLAMPTVADVAETIAEGRFIVEFDGDDVKSNTNYDSIELLIRGYTYVGDNYFYHKLQEAIVEVDLEGDWSELTPSNGYDKNLIYVNDHDQWIMNRDYGKLSPQKRSTFKPNDLFTFEDIFYRAKYYVGHAYKPVFQYFNWGAKLAK